MSQLKWARVAKRAINSPGRSVRLALSPEGWSGLYWLYRQSTPLGRFDATAGVAGRTYRSYDSYVAQQRSKLALLDLSSYDQTFRAGLAARLRDGGGDWAGRSVLCLAARVGTEVRAFHDVGAFAVGIDLNPGRDNRWVLPGDFHDLVFPAGSVDAVYCNSLDHAFDLSRTLGQVHQVLKPGGVFLVDAQQGADEVPFDAWAATSWTTIDDLVRVVDDCGFSLDRRAPITVPWTGEQLTFRKPPRG